MNALVLSGGGARGAYEAGVLAYLFEDLPKKHNLCPRFDIVCGSSVGAINAAFFASAANDLPFMIRNMLSAWETLSPEKVIRFSPKKLFTLPVWGFKGTTPEQSALFEVTPLIQLLKGKVSWAQIRRNIAKGPLFALTVSATDLETGTTVVFTQRKGGGTHPPSRDPYVTALPAMITPKHILASAAIPLVFPPVCLKNRFYYDGSIRQSTPISPALRLGAKGIFVVSLKSEKAREKFDVSTNALEINPNFLYMAGKLFNAFMLDRLAYDLDRLERFNQMLEMGEAAFGQKFLSIFNKTVMSVRGVPYRKVRTCVITPSEDLGEVAKEIKSSKDYREQKRKMTGKFLHLLSKVGFMDKSDILSYILFDSAYTRYLVELGRRDARSKAEEILSFFHS